MGDDRPDDAMEPGRAKRPPPTLELSATELPREDNPAADESVVQSDTPPDVQAPPRRGGGAMAGTLSGAVAGAIVAGLCWFATSTWLTSTSEVQPVAASPVPQVNTAAIDDLSSRVGKLEVRPAPAPPSPAPAPPDLSPLTARLDALDKAAATLRDETTALRTQSTQALSVATEAQKDAQAQPTPAAPDLSGITNRLGALETGLRAQNDKIAEQARKPADEIATRRIAAASLLDAQVRAGEPFTVALSAAKTLAPDATTLAPLDGFATTGIPSAGALARALLEMPQLAPPAPSGTASGLIERLQSGATKLVKIERTDSPNADNATFTRAADAARRDDVAAAARELGALPPAERAVVQPWLDRVAARDAARAASRQFANDALAAMPKP